MPGDPKTLLPNYQGLVFQEDQVGYLAGVLAGSVSKSGVIGTVGGINTIPAVTRYINGYRNGAASVNDKAGRQGGVRLDRHHQGVQ